MNDRSQNWLIYAIEQKTKNVISFIVGGRNTEDLKETTHLLTGKNRGVLVNAIKELETGNGIEKNLIE